MQKEERQARKEAIKQEKRRAWLEQSNLKQECRICACPLQEDTFFPLNSEGIIHEECLRMHIVVQTEALRFPIYSPICPKGSPPMIIPDIWLVLEDEEFEKFNRLSLRNYLVGNSKDMVGCPTPGCENFVFKGAGDEAIDHFCCGGCNRDYCLKCKYAWHGELTCEEAQKNGGYGEKEK